MWSKCAMMLSSPIPESYKAEIRFAAQPRLGCSQSRIELVARIATFCLGAKEKLQAFNISLIFSIIRERIGRATVNRAGDGPIPMLRSVGC